MLAKLAPPAIFFNTVNFSPMDKLTCFLFPSVISSTSNLVKNAFIARHHLEFKKILTIFLNFFKIKIYSFGLSEYPD